jgi:peptidoglycan hydrolase-like protein with peptidoglycan-binding domain
MQTISASVGENATNNMSDVALVQAILLKTRRAATPATPARPYLSSYDGDCGPITKAAIRSFQLDHVAQSGNGLAGAPNRDASAGLVKPGDATWRKLLEQVDGDFSDMRVVAGGKTVYLAATTAQLQERIAAANVLTFAPAFRSKVIACLNRMHALYGIAIGVCPQGDRRTFQSQYDLLANGRNVTKAGPGESNHNFGMAVDLGFSGLRWLKGDGTVTENETMWLHRLDAVKDQSIVFWEALRAVGTSGAVAAFRGPVADRPHLQNWDDQGVSMAARLADLLNRSGSMRWNAIRGSYSSDLGFGGELYPVGSAAQIWNRQATVTVAMLSRARTAQAAHHGHQNHGLAPRPAAFGRAAPAAPANPTQAEVVLKQQELRREFESADANWPNWTPR